MRLRNRREDERHPAGWIATYSPGSSEAWFSCEALDVSATGAGLILSGPGVEVGAPLILELQVNDGQPNGIRLEGTVRNVVPLDDRRTRVGVEFEPLKPLEDILLAVLLEEALAC